MTDTEATDLLAQLAVAREKLIGTTEGLTDEQAGATPTASSLCLGGLIKHVASMEETWVDFTVSGPRNRPLPDGVTWQDLFSGQAPFPQWMVDHQNEFRMQDGDTLAGVVARYREVAARSEKIIAELPDLDVTHPLPDAPWFARGEWTARRALLHLIAETAQHTGQADIIRESIDGKTAG